MTMCNGQQPAARTPGSGTTRRARALAMLACATAFTGATVAQPVQAQARTVVSACSGVSLP